MSNRKRNWSFGRLSTVAGLALGYLLLMTSIAYSIPPIVTQEGVVMTAAGAPLEGVHDIRIRLYETIDAELPFFD